MTRPLVHFSFLLAVLSCLSGSVAWLAAARAAEPGKAGMDAAAPATARQLPPLRQLLTSPFGMRQQPGWPGRGRGARLHAGVDLRAHIDWPVVALRPGTVQTAGNEGALGLAVIVRQDDGMRASYGHLGRTFVRAGQRVAAGEALGAVGCTGRTTGAHLHFALRTAAGEYVDPLPFLSRGEDVLRPEPAQIPEVLEAQSCGGPVVRGRDGRPTRLGLGELRRLEHFTPPPIPTWNQRH